MENKKSKITLEYLINNKNDIKNNNNDFILIKQSIEGNELAFKKLYLKYEKKLFNFIQRMIFFDNETARDILQETMYKVYKNLDKFNFKNNFSTWLYQIALNNVRDYKRKCIRNKTVNCDNTLLDILMSREQLFQNNPEQEYLKEELIYKLTTAIKKLPEKYITVFIMKNINNLKIKEIADIVGTSERSIKYILNKSTKLLYQDLIHYMK